MLDSRTTNINTLIFQHAASNMHHGMLVTQVSISKPLQHKKKKRLHLPALPHAMSTDPIPQNSKQEPGFERGEKCNGSFHRTHGITSALASYAQS